MPRKDYIIYTDDFVNFDEKVLKIIFVIIFSKTLYLIIIT